MPARKRQKPAGARKPAAAPLPTLRPEQIDADVTLFQQLPLSRETLRGLQHGSFVEMTEIQRTSLQHTLCGRDVLAAARTGSGKTLAFLIPLLEVLHRARWSALDGLGALVISPTRELALQIFEVLRVVGRFHSFSAGLLIGGKSIKQERGRVGNMNILVCTPGRLLQHMDESPDFACDALRMLVLDEADRVLDLGFEAALNAIIANLGTAPRQTLLFSATQSQSVAQLARLSLRDPVTVGAVAATEAPAGLSQRYIVCELGDKLDVLFSFLRTHTAHKTLVFVSSCKQVRFLYEAFCKLQPGVPLMQLHGQQKQMQRLAVFDAFCRKRHACLFATDVAARGLDFPAVDWVVQLDCPEDVDTYVHRAGRTARFDSRGDALTLLLPSEEPGMVAHWAERQLQVTRISVNPARQQSARAALASICAEHADVKYLAEKALVSYVRSVHLHKDKTVFDVLQLPLDALAASMGLPGTPKLKFVNRLRASRQLAARAADKAAAAAPKTRVERMFALRNQTVLSDHYQKHKSGLAAADEDDDELLVVKRRDHDVEDDERVRSAIAAAEAPPTAALTRREVSKAKQRALKQRGLGSHHAFDDAGAAVNKHALQTLEDFAEESAEPVRERAARFQASQAEQLATADVVDKETEREKRRERKLRKRERARREKSGAASDGDSGDDDGPALDVPTLPAALEVNLDEDDF